MQDYKKIDHAKNKDVVLRYVPGHFITPSSHVNYFMDTKKIGAACLFVTNRLRKCEKFTVLEVPKLNFDLTWQYAVAVDDRDDLYLTKEMYDVIMATVKADKNLSAKKI